MIARKVDQQLLEGSGSAPEVKGLKNVSGTQSDVAGTNGASTTFDMLMDMQSLFDGIGVPYERLRVIGHTRNLATLRKIKATTGQYVLQTALAAMGMSPDQFFWSDQLTTTETVGTSSLTNSIYMFDIQNVIFVPRTYPQIILDRSRLFNSDQSELRCTQRFDLICPQPSAIVHATGFLP